MAGMLHPENPFGAMYIILQCFSVKQNLLSGG